MRAYPNWRTIQNQSDIIGLLGLICTCMYAGLPNKKPTLSFIEAESDLITFRQTKCMLNAHYLEVFKNKTEVYEHMGGEPGTCEARIHTQLIKNGVPVDYATDHQYQAAKAEAKQEYLAGLFIKNCDPN